MKRKVFRVQHPDLQGLIGTEKQGLQYYSVNDLTNQMEALENRRSNCRTRKAARARMQKRRAIHFKRDLMHLCGSLALDNRLKLNLGPAGADDFQNELQVFEQALSGAGDAGAKPLIEGFHERYARAAELAYVRAVPPRPGQPRNAWTSVGGNLTQFRRYTSGRQVSGGHFDGLPPWESHRF